LDNHRYGSWGRDYPTEFVLRFLNDLFVAIFGAEAKTGVGQLAVSISEQ
jgi:hypothetical protein